MSPGTTPATVYVILGSHACRAGTLMLEHKGIPYRTVTLPVPSQPLVLPLLGFRGRTVPAMAIDGRRVQTNRAIARFLDELRPDPPLLPGDPARRREVEVAEEWADEELQMAARRLVLAGAARGREGLANGGDDGPLGRLLWQRPLVRRLAARALGRVVFNVNARTERQLLARVPGMLDRIDGWIDAGVLGGDPPTAADYSVGASLLLLTYRPDVAPQVEWRPARALADLALRGRPVATVPAR
ncbi:MAG TPA: glutathione S-transferase N-terminal domain-containing protein [Thermoleophilaceae bacterium]|jgi:glutathione S-transferase